MIFGLYLFGMMIILKFGLRMNIFFEETHFVSILNVQLERSKSNNNYYYAKSLNVFLSLFSKSKWVIVEHCHSKEMSEQYKNFNIKILIHNSIFFYFIFKMRHIKCAYCSTSLLKEYCRNEHQPDIFFLSLQIDIIHKVQKIEQNE